MQLKAITEYPRQIEEATLSLLDIEEELATLRDRLKDAEVEIQAAVLDARGDDNKPLYSNDRARDIALHRALKVNRAYQKDRATERQLERGRATLEAELDRLRRMYRIFLINFERQQLGPRRVA
jgi:hypothetical protein